MNAPRYTKRGLPFEDEAIELVDIVIRGSTTDEAKVERVRVALQASYEDGEREGYYQGQGTG